MPTRDRNSIPVAVTRICSRRKGGARFPRGKFSDRAEDLTPEQEAFAFALQQYKERTRNFFPNSSEVLEVIKSLGYRRVAAAQAA